MESLFPPQDHLHEWAWLSPPQSPTPSLQGNARKQTQEKPKPLNPGEALLVATHDGVASLFALVRRSLPEDLLGPQIELGYEAKQAWQDAFIAFRICAPILWQNRHLLCSKSPLLDPPRVIKIADFVPHGRCAHDSRQIGVIDGRSFGLAFFLAIASKLFGISLPIDLAGFGWVSRDGSIKPVDDVALKTRALIEKAIAVKRLLVAKENYDEAQGAACGSSLEVIPLAHAKEALDKVFGDKPQKVLLKHLHSKSGKEAVVKNLFDLTCNGIDAYIAWGAVANACDLVIKEARLDDRQRFEVGFAKAVAMRHKCNTGDMPLPDEALLKAYPLPVRLKVMAHLVQHCADTGSPQFEQVEPMVGPMLVRGKEAFVEHLRLVGAWGRLLAVCGSPQKALDCECEAVQGFLDLMEVSEVSRSLSFAFRLSGALEDKKTFLRLKTLKDELLAFGAVDEVSQSFIEVAEKGALVRLNMANLEDLQTLGNLADKTYLPEEVRYGVIRALTLYFRNTRALDKANSLVSLLEKSAQEHGGDFATITLALVQLDENPDDEEALSTLERLDPGPVSHLVRTATKLGEKVGKYVRTFYPY